jgi:hypothetical protein
LSFFSSTWILISSLVVAELQAEQVSPIVWICMISLVKKLFSIFYNLFIYLFEFERISKSISSGFKSKFISGISCLTNQGL